MVDGIWPQVESFTASDPLLTNADTVHYTLTFSEPVTGTDASQFTLATNGVIGALITDVTAVPGTNGAQYTVAVNTGTGDGSVTLNLTGQSVHDLTGNPLPGANIQPQSTYTTGGSPPSVAIGDLNGDGRPDLVTANWLADTLSVLLGNGNGTFQPQTTYAAGDRPNSVAIADVNGDGHLDLVVANAGPEDNFLSVLLGNGNGTFQPQTTYDVASAPTYVAIADLNDDDRLDLVTVNFGSNTTSVLLGNGSGTFRPQTSYSVDTAPETVAIADLNGDGFPDLVTANEGASRGSLSVLLGVGDGTFQPQIRYARGDSHLSVAIADLNGDRRQDLVTTNFVSNTLSVLLGNGDGTFSSETTYATGVGPHSVAIADLNGDGRPDLVADGTAPVVSVLLGNGNGTFQPQATYEVGSSPWSVAIADLNGDGRLDLVTANFSSDNASVLLNMPPTVTGPTYSIDKTPPSAPLITSYSGTTHLVGGSAEVGSIAALLDGLTQIGQVTADSSGRWSIATNVLSDGNHLLTARATDVAGNQSLASQVLSVSHASTAEIIGIEGGGNDTLTGGPGIDTAVFSGTLNQYSVRTGLGTDGVLHTIVAHAGGSAADGTDDLASVEKLQFTDGTITLHGAQQNHQSSVDGDRFDDVVLQNSSTGHVYYAKMVAGAFQSWGVNTGTLGGYDWQAIATGDVNPGSPGGAETFIQQQSTGTIYYASLDTGSTVWGVVSSALTSDWKLRAVADVNGDASVDAIVQNQANGTIYFADMKGGTFQNWGVVNTNLTGDWVAAGAGDVNADGFADVIVQQQSTGTTYFANMAGGVFSGWGVVSTALTADWKVKAVADVTGDGFADVIFQNAEGAAGVFPGTTYYADMKSGALDHWGLVTGSITNDWVVQGTADVDNDGYRDVLFQHSTDGTTYYAHMGANGFAGWGAVANNISVDWQVV